MVGLVSSMQMVKPINPPTPTNSANSMAQGEVNLILPIQNS